MMKIKHVFGVVLMLALMHSAVLAADSRPNILFILADDQSPFDLKIYDPNSSLDTPVIDRLAAEGVVFDGAYHMGAWSGAVCTPSRHMIMSGRTVWHIPGKGNPHTAKPELVPSDLAQYTMGAVFNRAGYDTMRTCKRGNSYAAANKQFTVVHEASKRGDTDQTGSAWHAEQVLNYLAEREAKKDTDPFLIYYGFSHPHDPRNGKVDLLAKYGAVNHKDKETLPSINSKQPKLPVNHLPAHPFPHGHPRLRDEVNVQGIWERRDEATLRNALGCEFACSENIDIQIGRVLDKLKAMGQLDNTIIIYTADHGIAIGRHGLQGKQNLYQHTWRVPYIVKGPGLKAGSRVEGNIYLLDTLRTLCDLAGIKSPAVTEGISFKPVLEGKQARVRDVLYGVYCGGTKPGMRSVKKGDWKLIKYDVLDGAVRKTQLFNLAENPNELLLQHHDPAVIALTGNRPRPNQVNLAADPQYAHKLKEMEALLLVEQRRLDDPYRLWDQPAEEITKTPNPLQSLDPYAHEAKEERDARMAWFREAKFGMFIHWGVYAVPAGTYKGKQIPGIGEWIMNRGKIPMAEYQAYAKEFNPVQYDPDAWVRLAKEAGMKYIVITSKHHDGFALYDSKVSQWDVVDATPYGKDLIAPLAEACKKHGLKLGLYYSQAQDWNQGGASGTWDPAQKHDMDDYIRDTAVPQVREILTQYSPDVLWWDTPHKMTNERAEQFLPLLKLRPGIIHNNRLGGDYKGDISTPEQHIPGTGLSGDWESCMTMNRTWGFKSYDHDWKSTEILLQNLVDIASKGGNYLLNVGPTAEGLIPEPSIKRLKAMGAWMKVNSESIYGTTASPCRTPTWGRITTRVQNGNTTLYLNVFDWPSDGKLFLPIISKVTACHLLADGTRKFQTITDERGTMVVLTGDAPDSISSVVVLKLVQEPVVSDADKIFQQADGSLFLTAQKAIISNVRDSHVVYNAANECIEGWAQGRGNLATVDWDFVVKSPGTFLITLLVASEEDSSLKLTAAGQSLNAKIPASGDFETFKSVDVGTVQLDKAGHTTIHFEPVRRGWKAINLHSVTFTPQR